MGYLLYVSFHVKCLVCVSKCVCLGFSLVNPHLRLHTLKPYYWEHQVLSHPTHVQYPESAHILIGYEDMPLPFFFSSLEKKTTTDNENWLMLGVVLRHLAHILFVTTSCICYRKLNLASERKMR